MTTDTSTEAVERLLDGVTPGPWAWQTDTEIALDSRGYVIASTELSVHDEPEILANARFIAASRDLVPALLAERDAALARAERAEAALRRIEERTLERAAEVAEDYNDEIWDYATGNRSRVGSDPIAEAIRGLPRRHGGTDG
jgi:hypothetical protein